MVQQNYEQMQLLVCCDGESTTAADSTHPTHSANTCVVFHRRKYCRYNRINCDSTFVHNNVDDDCTTNKVRTKKYFEEVEVVEVLRSTSKYFVLLRKQVLEVLVFSVILLWYYRNSKGPSKCYCIYYSICHETANNNTTHTLVSKILVVVVVVLPV
jgi:hypothetical protein